MSGPEYRVKTAKPEEIYFHLKQCSDNFIPPLGQTVNIEQYAEKLFDKAITFEAWNGPELAGLIAAYFNDESKHSAFVTNVSVLSIYKGKGIATTLLNHCIQYAREKRFKEISLEVNKNNSNAIFLYKKNNFRNSGSKNDLLIMKLFV